MKPLSDDYFVKCGRDGTPLTDCLVIDAHSHLGQIPGFSVPDSSLESLVQGMDAMGIDKIFASSMLAINGRHIEGNDLVIEAVRRYPDRIAGYMAVNVGYPEMVLPELDRCYEAGFRAIKIYNYATVAGLPYDHRNFDIIYDFANRHRLPILAHTWGETASELEPAFKNYPRVNWLLAHAGSDALETYTRLANEYENVYLDTCFSSAPRGLIEKFVSTVPLHKIIWGSDQMFMNAAHQIGRVLFAQITTEQKEAILGLNAARILPIE